MKITSERAGNSILLVIKESLALYCFFKYQVGLPKVKARSKRHIYGFVSFFNPIMALSL